MKEYIHPTKHEIEVALERIELYKELINMPKPDGFTDRENNEHNAEIQKTIDTLAAAICDAVVEFKNASV